MLCYLNRGLILEQAVCAIVHEYFDALHLENTYKNFHITVTTEHPFARLYLYDGLNAADSFPAVVITTQEDTKPSELDELAPQVQLVEITEADLNQIAGTDDAGEKNALPGLCTVVDEKTLETVRAAIREKGSCAGYAIRTRRRDSMGIEIWSENIQLKNELYEQLRLFVTGNLRHILADRYPFFDIAIFDGTVNGHRSNNFNYDFDVILAGAHIAFDVNYCVEQIVIDTDAEKIKDFIFLGGINHVG